MAGGPQNESETNLVASPLEPMSIKLHCIPSRSMVIEQKFISHDHIL